MLSARAPAARPCSSSRQVPAARTLNSGHGFDKLVDFPALKPSVRCQAVQGGEEAPQEQVKKQRITDILKEPSKIKRRGLMMAGAAAMFGCACCSDLVGAVGAAKADAWKYDGGGGPYAWTGACATGESQSPVNVIQMPEVKTKGKYPIAPMDFNYGRYEKVDILNTGHGTMQVNFKPGNGVYVPPRLVPTPELSSFQEETQDGQAGGDCLCPSVPFNLDLIQYHFHTPSEHTLDGNQYVMEAHLVHRNKDTGGLAVIAVLMEPGGASPNPCLQLGLDFAPEDAGKPIPSPKVVNPVGLLPPKNSVGAQPYIHYSGSLTTPPCSEPVDFFVMTTPIKVTDKQAIDFMYFVGNKKTYAYNNRPVQPLNGRKFEYFEYEL